MAFDEWLPGERPISDLPGMVSLGGCVVGHLASSLNGKVIDHRRHMWRRPTIAMMSAPVSRFRFDFTKLPPQFANYFVNDAGGKHQHELLCRSPEKERVFVFDVTRDVFTGVVEIEPDVWVMDPVDAIHMVDGLTTETMSGEILEEICRDSVRRVSAVRNWDDFFPVWKEAFSKFAAKIDGQYERVMIAEIYPTLTRLDSISPFYALNIEEMNERLDHMYAWIRETFDFEWIGISREHSVTGFTGVPYNGPTPTHFIGETHGVFALDFIRKLNKGYGDNHPKHDETLPLIEQAFERAKLHEEALEDIVRLKKEVESLTDQIATAEACLAEKQAEHLSEIDAREVRFAAREAELAAELDVRATRSAKLEAELAAQILASEAQNAEMEAAAARQSENDAVVHAFVLGQYNEAQVALAATQAHIEALEHKLSVREQMLASPWRVLKHALARKTRKLRGQ